MKINTTQKKYKSELMKRILEVRYTDLEEEKNLCKQLLEVAEPDQDTHGCAFANVYMLDSLLALGEYSSCDFYLIRASFLCREHGYDDLLLFLCNCAGLYYLKLNDEQTALQYYLEGLKLAQRLGEFDIASKLLNNIGIGFGGRGDWATAIDYFEQAFQMIENHLDVCNQNNVVSYLSNIAECRQNLGEEEASRQALMKCEEVSPDSIYHKIRLGSAWAAHYSIFKDFVKCAQTVDNLLALGLVEFANRFFACDTCIALCDYMIDAQDKARSAKLMGILERFEEEAPLNTRSKIQQLKIRYWQYHGNEDELNKAYQANYDSAKQIYEMEDQARSQSMLSKIQMTTMQMEREEMRRLNRELENDGQVDGLTGLYNRRYLNKLISKVMQGKDLHTIGFIMLDVDYFKQYNDFYGHFMGDSALKAVADSLVENVVDGIYVSRYGGDEYVCFCVNQSDVAVEKYVQQIRLSLKDKKIAHEKSLSNSYLTISIGYCNEPFQTDMSATKLLQVADEALYLAKQSGRNGYHRKYLT